MGHPIKKTIEIVNDKSKEEVIAHLQEEVVKAQKDEPNTIFQKYAVVTSTGEYVGVVSKESADILGLKDTVIEDRLLMNVPVEDIPVKFIKNYELIVENGASVTDEEAVKISQDKANKILTSKGNSTIPVVTLTTNKDGEAVTKMIVPSVFGADFFSSNKEQLKEGVKFREMDQSDVDAVKRSTEITLKNRNVKVIDSQLINNNVEAAVKKAAIINDITKDVKSTIEKQIQETAKNIPSEKVKAYASEVEKVIKLKNDINGIDAVVTTVGKKLLSDVLSEDELNSIFSKIGQNVQQVTEKHLSIPTQKDGSVSDVDAKIIDEIRGNTHGTENLQYDELIETADKIKTEVREGLNVLQVELSDTDKDLIASNVAEGILHKHSDNVINKEVYNYLVKKGMSAEDAEEITLAVATIVDKRKVAQFDDAKYPISDELLAQLKHMANEEKLAMELYQHAFKLYPDEKVFLIGDFAEKKHMENARALAEKYGIPAEELEPLAFGEYSDNKVQELYNVLVKEIEESKIKALQVGVKVEVVDTEDIRGLIEQAKKEKAKDIEQVYSNLIKASQSHYWSFDKALRANGIEDGAASAGEEFVKTEEEYPKAFSVKKENGKNNSFDSDSNNKADTSAKQFQKGNTEVKNTEVKNTEVKNTEVKNTKVKNTEVKNTADSAKI